MNCAICGIELCGHWHTVHRLSRQQFQKSLPGHAPEYTSDGWTTECRICGKTEFGTATIHQYSLPMRDGRIDRGSDVYGTVCKVCHDNYQFFNDLYIAGIMGAAAGAVLKEELCCH